MANMTDGERIAEERIAEAARTGQDWLDLGGLGLARLPERLAKLTWLQRLSIGNSIHVGPEDKEFIRSGDTGNALSDLSPLSRLTRLNDLYMDGTGCADLSPIAGVQHLRHLNCSDTKIEDLTPVIGLKELEYP
jgi:Leucine-rich repeat (LRR) protein